VQLRVSFLFLFLLRCVLLWVRPSPARNLFLFSLCCALSPCLPSSLLVLPPLSCGPAHLPRMTCSFSFFFFSVESTLTDFLLPRSTHSPCRTPPPRTRATPPTLAPLAPRPSTSGRSAPAVPTRPVFPPRSATLPLPAVPPTRAPSKSELPRFEQVSPLSPLNNPWRCGLCFCLRVVFV
jgi:hypothetical protein